MITKLTGLSLAASPLGTLVRTVNGLPQANLLRYYGLLDGSLGSTPTQFADASGTAPAAVPLAGAAEVTRTAGGIMVPEGPGFAFDSGVPLAGARTLVIATRDLNTPQSENAGLFNMFAGPVAKIATPMSGAAQSNTGPGPYLLSQAYPASNGGARRAFAGSPSLFASGSNVKQIVMEGGVFDAWKIVALSWDVSSGVFRLAGFDSATTSETTETAFLDAMVGFGSTIAFGSWQHQGAGAAAELGLFAIYDVAKTLPELQSLCTQAAAVITARGETVPG